jgi:hypothetical protein
VETAHPSSLLGKSRSAAAVVELLMARRGLRLNEAINLTSQARPVIDIAPTFKQQLMDLELKLWPDLPPSVVLSLKSRRPVLSSSSRSRGAVPRSRSEPPKPRERKLKPKVGVTDAPTANVQGWFPTVLPSEERKQDEVSTSFDSGGDGSFDNSSSFPPFNQRKADSQSESIRRGSPEKGADMRPPVNLGVDNAFDEGIENKTFRSRAALDEMQSFEPPGPRLATTTPTICLEDTAPYSRTSRYSPVTCYLLDLA